MQGDDTGIHPALYLTFTPASAGSASQAAPNPRSSASLHRLLHCCLSLLSRPAIAFVPSSAATPSLLRARRAIGGVPPAITAEYYRQRATEGGLIVSEATCVSPTAHGGAGQLGRWGGEEVGGWGPPCCSRAGARIFGLQRRQAHPAHQCCILPPSRLSPTPVPPSLSPALPAAVPPPQATPAPPPCTSPSPLRAGNRWSRWVPGGLGCAVCVVSV